MKLPAATLKGTFLKAYKLLTEITAKVGWDALLKYRSSVFVMEEEYRNEKSEQQEKEKTASTTALRGTSPAPPSTRNSSINGDDDAEHAGDNNSVSGEDEKLPEPVTDGAPTIEKPEQTVDAEEVKAGPEDFQTPKENTAKKYTHFQNKRLCERWLDNLFMLLYEVCVSLLLYCCFGNNVKTVVGSPCLHNLESRSCSVQTKVQIISQKCLRTGNSW